MNDTRDLYFEPRKINLNPNDYSGYFKSGYIYHDMAEYEKSLNYYLKSFDINPEDKALLNNIGLVYECLKNYEQALYYFNLCIAKHPDYCTAFYNRGRIYESKNIFSLGIEDFTTAIQLEPSFIGAYIARGNCYMQIGKYNDALEDYRKGTKLTYPHYKSTKLVTIHKANQFRSCVITYENFLTKGFFPVIRGDTSKCLLIYPFGNDKRIILRPENIHISRTNKRHLRQYAGRYELKLNAGFDTVMNRLDFHYKEKDKNCYLDILRNFFPLINKYARRIKFISVSLFLDGRQVAGDLGILLEEKKLYQSLTGFHETYAPSSGSVLLILLANELEKLGITLWDLGQSYYLYNPYKFRLGGKRMCLEEYQNLFFSINPD